MVLDMINFRPIPLDTLLDLPTSALQGLLRRHLRQNIRVLRARVAREDHQGNIGE